MNPRTPIVAVAALLAACATTPAAPPRAERATALDAAQAAQLERMVGAFVAAEGHPSLVVAVVRGGEPIWEAGFGEGAGREPDADTVFRAGSITKVVTAAALLRLVDEGVLSLDDEVARWLPEVRERLSPPGKEPVRLRHLLAHASGLPPSGYPGLDTLSGVGLTEADVFASLEGVKFLFEPGTNHAYSNMNFVLAGLVVARASGMPYRDFVQKNVLEPLGMRASTWDPPAHGLAPGHLVSARGGYERSFSSPRLGILEPAGGLFTSARDLGRLAAYGLGHLELLTAETFGESMRRQSPTTGPFGFGLGWLLLDDPDLGEVVWHNGSTQDYGAFLALHRPSDLAVVVLGGTGALGDVDEMQSLGLAILAHLVVREAGRMPRPSRTPETVVEAVGAKLLQLTTAPTREVLETAFAPSWFDAIPLEQSLRFFEQIARESGGCTSYELVEDRGRGIFALHLRCARGNAAARVTVEVGSPYRIAGLYLTPAP